MQNEYILEIKIELPEQGTGDIEDLMKELEMHTLNFGGYLTSSKVIQQKEVEAE